MQKRSPSTFGQHQGVLEQHGCHSRAQPDDRRTQKLVTAMLLQHHPPVQVATGAG
jgi:hypothetical protein